MFKYLRHLNNNKINHISINRYELNTNIVYTHFNNIHVNKSCFRYGNDCINI